MFQVKTKEHLKNNNNIYQATTNENLSKTYSVQVNTKENLSKANISQAETKENLSKTNIFQLKTTGHLRNKKQHKQHP